MKSLIASAKQLQDAFKKMANGWKGTHKLGGNSETPQWVDPSALLPIYQAELNLWNSNYLELRESIYKGAPPLAGCGVKKEIDMGTNMQTCDMPHARWERDIKPLLPFQAYWAALDVHERHHSAECMTHQVGGTQDGAPWSITPYGMALEEAAAYGVEIAQLEQVAEQCRKKLKFNNVPLTSRMGDPRAPIVTTMTLSGEVCGNPYEDQWTIKRHTRVVMGGRVVRDAPERDMTTDCVAPASQQAGHYEEVIKNGPAGATAWYCIYSPGDKPTVTIRMPKLWASTGAGDIRFDGPESKVADVTEGSCDDAPAGPIQSPPAGSSQDLPGSPITVQPPG